MCDKYRYLSQQSVIRYDTVLYIVFFIIFKRPIGFSVAQKERRELTLCNLHRCNERGREGGCMYNNIEIRHLLSNTVAHELGTGMQRATTGI